MNDVIIIGAGPAGLQAALTLGRMHRSVLLVDSGQYRNGAVLHMHNVVTHDGADPAQFRAIARSQLHAYETVAVKDATALRVSAVEDGFELELADGTTERAGAVLLATGMADDLPPVPGLDELWGVRAFSCPFCDGHEFAGRRVGVLGGSARTDHLIRMLRPIVGSVVVLDGGELEAGPRAEVEALGAQVHSAPVEAVAAHGDGVRVRAGVDVDVAGLFVTGGTTRQRAPFAEQLGLRMLPSGAVEIDDFGRTSLPGVWAAGDLAHRPSVPGVMAAVTVAAAAGLVAAAGIVQELSAR